MQQPLEYAIEADEYDDVQNAPGSYNDYSEYRRMTPRLPSYYFDPDYYNTPDVGARALPDYAPPGYEARDYQDAPGVPEFSRITTPTRAGSSGNYVTQGMFPGSFLVPGTATSFRFRGFVRLAALGDFDPIGSTDSFVPNTIPVPQQDGRNFNMSARISRFALESWTPTTFRDWNVHTFIEATSLMERHKQRAVAATRSDCDTRSSILASSGSANRTQRSWTARTGRASSTSKAPTVGSTNVSLLRG